MNFSATMILCRKKYNWLLRFLKVGETPQTSISSSHRLKYRWGYRKWKAEEQCYLYCNLFVQCSVWL